MIAAFITCGILMILVRIFERERNLDFMDVSGIVIAPLLASLVVGGIAYVLDAGLWGQFANAAIFAGLTFYMLKGLLALPAARAAIYTSVVIVVNIGVSILLALFSHR
ncbi:MAG: hypothetical protein JWQ90_2538 [Hydrocarboniphaga sp.]|uniref:hypothetical protein n=1 Tax=Hydrocarboniphaga sp. TaxID=2033016 RepID=UPI002615ACBC|nr:hypothetical protein [Hydrocarboniphaga sp.]MDB5970088.1 hypothetical protein [Hydrocarboniphaga sp.]